MRGTIIKRGRKYYIVVDLGKGPDGKRRQKWFSGYDKKKDAEKDIANIISKIENNDFVLPKKCTVGQYLIYWLELEGKKWAPTTYDGYETIIVKHIIPILGTIQLQKLSPMDIEKYINIKLRTLSGTTVLHHYRVLHKALEFAYNMQLISKNPMDMVEPPKAEKYKAEVLTPDQAKNLLEAVEHTYLKIPTHIGLSLGLRRGEILALRWDDVDFVHNTITVKQNLVRAGGELIFTTPKSDTSNRVLIAPEGLMKVLKAHKIAQQELQLRSYGKFKNDENLVCTRPAGGPINPCTFSTVFSKFLKRHKLPVIRFHDTRHTNATFMLLDDTPMKVASERLGHSSIGITMDLYTSVLKQMDKEAAEKLNETIYK